MPEWLKGADCKSVAFRYVGSNPTRPKLYMPTIFIIIMYKVNINKINAEIKIIRNFLTLNRFLNGVKITIIRPVKLLIKNLG